MKERKRVDLRCFARMIALSVALTVSGCTEPDRRTTAGEVVDAETLKAFVEGAKEYLEGLTTLKQTSKVREVFGSEGEWKSGSMYLSILLDNGTFLLHGGNPKIENQYLIDLEDDRGKQIIREFLAATERGGDFVEYYWDDPSVDGDEGPRLSYAVGYVSGLSGNILTLVGGYHQDLSDVISAHPESERPEVTAGEVVDRDTLHEFVKAASRIFRQAVVSDDETELIHVKNAFRSEGGFWKSGPVYVFVVTSDGIVHLDGAEPAREGSNISDLVDVHGVNILEELVRAASSHGGYAEHFWDESSVRSGNGAGAHQTTYVEGFKLPNQDLLWIVGSGIHLPGGDVDRN